MAVQILVVQPDLNLGIVKTLNLLQSDSNPGHEVVMIFCISVPDCHYQAPLFDEAQIHL